MSATPFPFHEGGWRGHCEVHLETPLFEENGKGATAMSTTPLSFPFSGGDSDDLVVAQNDCGSRGDASLIGCIVGRRSPPNVMGIGFSGECFYPQMVGVWVAAENQWRWRLSDADCAGD
jgi:hypothetical protein